VEDTELMLRRPREEAVTKMVLFEVEADGYRMRAAVARTASRCCIRARGWTNTQSFPEIARAVKRFPVRGRDPGRRAGGAHESGHPSFNKLQTRAKLGAREARRAAIKSRQNTLCIRSLAFRGL